MQKSLRRHLGPLRNHRMTTGMNRGLLLVADAEKKNQAFHDD